VICSSQNKRTCGVGLFFTEQRNLHTLLQEDAISCRVLLVEYQKIEYASRVPGRTKLLARSPSELGHSLYQHILAILPLKRASMVLPTHELLLQSRKK
jgi:hypothetical protein